jgi:mRNA interferase YafQ
MLQAALTSGFKRNTKRLQKKHYDMALLRKVMTLIATDTSETRATLVAQYNDHALKGDKQGYRECHVDNHNDWLLAYSIDEDAQKVIFAATGSHDDLFGKRSNL